MTINCIGRKTKLMTFAVAWCLCACVGLGLGAQEKIPPPTADTSQIYIASAGGELVATGKTFFDESENSAVASEDHTIVNARFGYDAPRWRITVYGENLNDEHYAALIVPGVRHAAPGAPRTFGLEAAVKW